MATARSKKAATIWYCPIMNENEFRFSGRYEDTWRTVDSEAVLLVDCGHLRKGMASSEAHPRGKTANYSLFQNFAMQWRSFDLRHIMGTLARSFYCTLRRRFTNWIEQQRFSVTVIRVTSSILWSFETELLHCNPRPTLVHNYVVIRFYIRGLQNDRTRMKRDILFVQEALKSTKSNRSVSLTAVLRFYF